jgi:hypothetical protein
MGVEITGAQTAGGGGGGASQAAAALAPVGSTVKAQAEAQSVSAYWTKAAMDAAIPKDMPTQAAPAKGAVVSAGAASGAAKFGAGANLAGLEEVSSGGGVSAPMLSTGGPQPAQTGVYPSPFTRWGWFGKYTTYPQSTVAKVFFTQYGTNYVCSGAVVRPGVLDTAGHCTHAGDNSGNGFSYNVSICPSYNASGVNPAVGCWGASQDWTGGGWYTWGDFDNDFGSFVVSTNGGVCHCRIENAVGYLGYAYNFSRDQHWIAEGYPQASPFNGTKLITNAGEWWQNVAGCSNNFGCHGYPASVSQGNDMTGGSSGGPWIMSFGTGNYLNGHNDWKYSSTPLSMQSPYYDGNWAAVTNAACTSYSGSNCV